MTVTSAPTQTVLVGATATLTCTVDPISHLGGVIPRLEWFRVGAGEQGGLPFGRANVTKLGRVLVLFDVQKADQGTYVCSGNDGFKTRHDEAKVIIIGAIELLRDNGRSFSH